MTQQKTNPRKDIHWADNIAEIVRNRAQQDPILKKTVKQKGYIVYDEKTPSGKIHIGAGRGWIIHDSIAKAMRDKGMKAKFILSSDDIDPFDKMNKDLPATYKKYLGMPFRNIPSPEKGYESFASLYFSQCTQKFEEYGIEAEIQSTGKAYDKGLFNRTIKIALDNADKIQEIYSRFSRKGSNGTKRLPFNPICEKCGKIGTTYAYEWDQKREIIKYRCEPNLVDWAKGCGHKGEISPYNGNGKFPWKVEWAAKWPTIGVAVETAGKDHFTYGGSRSVAIAISDEIFNYPPPYPSTRKEIGKAYEFFTIGGKKMSTSKGMGVSFVGMSDYAPASLLRYLLVKTRPHAVIDFDPIGTNKIILLYESYDRTERIYYNKEHIPNEKEARHEKRVYELSHVDPIKKTMPTQIPFTYAATLVQITGNVESAIETLEKTGHINKSISAMNRKYITERLNYAKKWTKEFAPDEYKFIVNKSAPANKLKKAEVSALLIFRNKLSQKREHTEDEYMELIRKTVSETGIAPREFYKAAYLALLNKEHGPKLTSLIKMIGQKKTAMILTTLEK
ncbi:MAG: lysine--tRNA ligase [Candidatus Nanohalarchaeota archaeon]|nr:MAG: lysine--tRNA ligase [Candidatus Nanohaloarchaeota archaeon]